MFSSRTPNDLSLNAFARAVEKAGSEPLLDLTLSNPTQCGFDYPAGLLQPLSRPEALVYEPHSLGHPAGREAVARYLASRGQTVDPQRILLTASTSEAYSYLFKLLGDPGDSFLVPTPGYPLLDHLVHLEGVELVPYPLQMKADWPVDREKIRHSVGLKTKGIVVVDPHNPTGCFLSAEDRLWLFGFCKERSLAYISDEVFSEYAYEGPRSDFLPGREILSFRLGGLSKSLGLPQLKLSWMAWDGPRELLEECRERLELIADTYLSVNTPVQLALDELFRFAPVFQRQLMDRVLTNRAFLAQSFQSDAGVKIWPAQGGWYALLELPGWGLGDTDVAVGLLEEKRVLVQPGAFFDFPSGCFLVLSLLPLAKVFQEGALRIHDYLKKKN